MKAIYFTKMQALSNDFVCINAVTQSIYLPSHKVSWLADRRRGIGFDQLLLLEPPYSPEIDFYCRIYNADGTQASQCGNGMRCLFLFIRNQRLSYRSELSIATNRTVVLVSWKGNSAQISVDMGRPKAGTSLAELKLGEAFPADSCYHVKLNGIQLNAYLVDIGNLHLIVPYSASQGGEEAWTATAAQLRSQLNLPTANVSFMEMQGSDRVYLKTVEYGAGFTPGCGSAACSAAVVFSALRGSANAVQVCSPGGSVLVSWNDHTQTISLTGEAIDVYQGWIRI